MPIYEYLCPEHGKFEAIKAMAQRHNGLCSSCELVISPFNIYDLHWAQKDGEGFTQKTVRIEEYGEMNQELRER